MIDGFSPGDFFKRHNKIFFKKVLKKNASKDFGEESIVRILSPGRVNIIGEHTDYNSGLAIPLAIDKYKYFSAIKNNKKNKNKIEIYDNYYKENYIFNLDNIYYDNNIKWVNYIKGVVREYILNGFKISGFTMIIDSNLSSGVGISSSAAILAGTAMVLEELFNLKVAKIDTMNFCHNSENKFVGIDNGILDHFSVLFGKKNNAIYLDFSNNKWEYIPFELKENLILIVDSREERYLPETDYNKRRKECGEALEKIINITKNKKLESLSGIDIELLNAVKQNLPPILYKRVKHVVTENERVKKVKKFLKHNDFKSLGLALMESHESLKNDYEVSTERLDFIVDNMIGLNGVYGARMMGAGFGGTVISIIKQGKIDEVMGSLTEKYYERFKIKPNFISCSSSDGTKRIF
jgi:galactokinase